MRILLPSLLGLAFAAALYSAAAETAGSVSDWSEAMSADAVKLDARVTERQKAGDMGAAQRLALAAAMVRRAADELRSAEQEKLTAPLNALPAPLPERAAEALALADQAGTDAAGAPGFIDAELRGVNALMAALPTKSPHPIVYGLLSRDLESAGLPADVVVYGFRLTDAAIDAKPAALFERREIPSRPVGDVRLDITLPDEVRAQVNFDPPPCEQRAGFGLRIRVAYTQPKGFWPLRWREEVVTNTDVFALPTPVIYAVRATLSAQDRAPVAARATYQQSSDLAGADCEETRQVEVSAPLPAGARNATCESAWARISGATQSHSRCTVAGGVAHAIGDLTGGARICSPEHLCTCPNPAQGFLQVKGSYEISEEREGVELSAEASPLVFAAGGVADTKLALAPTQRLRHVTIDISRRQCPRASDRIDLSLVGEGQSEAQGVSKTGAFRASLAGATLRVGAAANFGAEVGRAP